MTLLYIFVVLLCSIELIDSTTQEILVESPFYLRARIHDAHTVNVKFEVIQQHQQRSCHMYKFTIRRNSEHAYSMPEQNLTFYSNSLELQHLPVGKYRVCAIICSEYLSHVKHHYKRDANKNRTLPLTACVTFDISRPHLLVLTLYVLVILILIISQMVFSLRKRQLNARMKLVLIEAENILQKWRQNQSPSISTDCASSYGVLQGLITLPASPIEQSTLPLINDEQRPVIFHIQNAND
mgnify:CR=1 FL=1